MAGSAVGETCTALSPVASSWAVLQAGEMQKMTMFLPCWFSPKIWCFYDQPPRSKRQRPHLEGILGAAPSAPDPCWFIGGSKHTMGGCKGPWCSCPRGRSQFWSLQANSWSPAWFYLLCLTHPCLQSLFCGFLSRQFRCLFSLLLAIPFMGFLVKFMDKDCIVPWW